MNPVARHRCCLWPVGLCLSLAVPLQAETVARTHGAATVRASAPAVSDGKLQITLSGQITVTVTVEGSAPVEVKPGVRVAQDASWQVSETAAPKVTALGNGKDRWEQTLVVEPMSPGAHKLQINPFEYRERGGDWRQVPGQEFPVVVITQVTPETPLQPPPPIEELPPAESFNWLVPVVVGVGVLVIVGLGIWMLRRRPARRKTGVPPARAALQRLEQLRRDLPANSDDSRRFHTQLADVVRGYLEAAFQIPASRRTSEEYYQALARSDRLAAGQLERLHAFLARCDVPRFAPVYPSTAECLETIALARAFIEETAPDRKPPVK